MFKLILAIRNGDVQEFKRLMEDETCDVNKLMYRVINKDGLVIRETPLLVSLQGIKSENDEWFQISQMLLEHGNIDVNAECGYFKLYNVLSSLCGIQCESTIGVRMLLEDSRTDVNKGPNTPLFCAVKNIARKDDYFHECAKLLLNHKDISINAEDQCNTALHKLCSLGSKSTIGVQMLLNHPEIHLYKGSAAFELLCLSFAALPIFFQISQ